MNESSQPPPPPPHHRKAFSVSGKSNDNAAPASTQNVIYPHFRDLVTRAEESVATKTTLEELVQRAENALKQAQTSLKFEKPDHACTEFLIASIIVVEKIPRHQHFSRLSPRTLNGLQREINTSQRQFEEVKAEIVENNRVNRTLPRSAVHSSPSPTTKALRVQLEPHSPLSQNLRALNEATPFTKPVEYVTGNFSQIDHTHGASEQGYRARAATGIPRLSSTGSMTHPDVLQQRFSRLRTSHTVVQPNGPTSTLKAPPKSIPLEPSSHSGRLPKPPSPTYSPTRGSSHGFHDVNGGHGISGPSIGRPHSGITILENNFAHLKPAIAPLQQPNTSEDSTKPSTPRRRKSINAPREEEITAEKLYDYLEKFMILVIDVRRREDFERGHIPARNSICVEPVLLRPAMSAVELREALVLAPESEQELFDRRDEFDLVVFHDESTRSSRSFRNDTSSNAALKFLYDALYEFNPDRPLKYPPALLVGGIDAWIDLVGPEALESCSPISITHTRTGGTLVRAATVDHLHPTVQRIRHREYNPLDPEEEEAWRAKSQHALAQDPAHATTFHALDSQGSSGDGRQPGDDPFPTSSILERYPDVATIEERTLVSTSPSRAPPEPPRLSTYPDVPISTIPARPAPALPRKSYSGVSERAIAQGKANSSSQLPAYIPPRLTRLPRIGLYNFGVTCYMNATVQCLSATIDLTTFFLDGKWSRYLQEQNWKGSKGILPNFYFALLKNLWMSKDVDTIRPSNFRKFCARLNKEWGQDRQQDAKEFLEFLIDCLHEDFNSNWTRQPMRPLTMEEEARRERMPQFIASKIEWDRYVHRDASPISDLFAGQHISRLQCTACGHSSTTFEPFYSVSVEIPAPAPAQHGIVDIRDCLRSYCSDEKLSGDELWRCPRCQKDREAIKRITISRAPRILVIHFKRFSASHSERARKIHTPVKFPLRGFDLGPFMLPTPDDTTRNQIMRRFPHYDASSPTSMQPPYKYDAYAVMRHIGGTLMSGHYTCLVQDQARGCWREFNDDRVRDFQPDELLPAKRLQNEQAYIVFYHRTDS